MERNPGRGLPRLSAVSHRRPVPEPPKVLSTDLPALLEQLDDARQAMWRGDLDAAERGLDRVLGEADGTPESDAGAPDVAAVKASAHSLRGQILAERGDEPNRIRDTVHRAVDVFRLMAGRHPGTAQTWADYGAALDLLGLTGEAEAKLQQAVRLGDASPATARRLARLLLADDANPPSGARACEARTVLQAASTAAPRDVELLTLLGEAELALGHRAVALVRFRDAATSAHGSGDFDRADALYRRAIDLDAGDADLHYRLGDVTLRRGGSIKDAVAAFDRALEVEPGHVGATIGKADAMRVAGELDDALRLVERVLAVDSRSADALTIKGDILRYRERNDEALAALDASLTQEPDSAWTIGTRGQVYRALGRADEAQVDLRRAVESEPGLAWAWAELAATHYELRELDAAERAAEQALGLDADIPLALATLARCRAETGREAQAVELLERLRDLAVDLDWVCDELVSAYLRGGAIDSARHVIQEALRAGRPAARLWRAELRAVTGEDMERAADDLDAYLADTGGEVDDRYRAALVYRALGAHDRAVNVLEGALRVEDRLEIRREKGAAELDLGRYEAVLDTLGRLPDLDTDSDDLWRRGEAARMLGKDDVAQHNFRSVLDEDPTDLRALDGLTRLSLADGKIERARKFAQRGLSAHPQDSRALATAALVELVAQRYDDAFGHLDRALRTDPITPETWSLAADALLETGQFVAASEILNGIHVPGRSDPNTFAAFGFALENVAAGEVVAPVGGVGERAAAHLARAEEVYRDGLRLRPTDRYLGRGLADVLFAQGERDAAREGYQMIVDASRDGDDTPGLVGILGWCQFRLGQHGLAIRTFTSALSAHSGSPDDRYLDFDLALALTAEDGAERGRAAYERACRLVGDLPSAPRRGLLAVARNDLAISIATGSLPDPVAAWELVDALEETLRMLAPPPTLDVRPSR